MTEFWLSVSAAFGLGLAGAGHCLGMCGGVVAALSFAVPEQARTRQWRLHLGYNLGRIASYGVIGLAVGILSELLPSGGLPWARTLAGLLLIAMGLHMAALWRGILWLERGGRYVWRWIKPLGDRFMPLDSVPKALAVGAVWGWLPCGLVYAALGYALAQQNVIAGAGIMLAFGLGTLPALLLGGLAAARLKAILMRRWVQVGLALFYVAFGIWTLAGAWYHVVGHDHPASVNEQSEHYHHH